MCEPCRLQVCVSDRQQEAQVHSFTGSGSGSGSGGGWGPLLHFVGSVRLVSPDDGQRVGLCVEDPVVEREVVVVREEQVEVPAGDTRISTDQHRLRPAARTSRRPLAPDAAEARWG